MEPSSDEVELWEALTCGESMRDAVSRLGIPYRRAYYLALKWTRRRASDPRGRYEWGTVWDLGWIEPAPLPALTGICLACWGTHGCKHPPKHEAPHECDCCTCDDHSMNPDPDCVAKPPYCGDGTVFYGRDA